MILYMTCTSKLHFGKIKQKVKLWFDTTFQNMAVTLKPVELEG